MPLENGVAELTVVLDPAEVRINPAEVLRYLGYPDGAAVARRIAEKVAASIEECRATLHPRGLYAVYPVTRQTDDGLVLADDAAFSGEIGAYLSGAVRAAVFVATAGLEIVDLAEAATRARDTLSGLVYSAIGSHLAESAAKQLEEDLRGRLQPEESLTLPYSPGYCGISLAQQKTVFRLVNAGEIGVELMPTLIMKPVKSVSGLIGIGPLQHVTAFGNPCDKCPMHNCRMRRESGRRN